MVHSRDCKQLVMVKGGTLKTAQVGLLNSETHVPGSNCAANLIQQFCLDHFDIVGLNR